MIPFLLVHEMLLNMVSKGGNRLGQLAELLPDSPLFNLRKAFCVKNHLDWMKTIAIGFHGDGVPHSKKGSAQVISWNVLGKSLAERFFERRSLVSVAAQRVRGFENMISAFIIHHFTTYMH